MSWLGELGQLRVQIELDCKLVGECIMDSSNNQSYFVNILSNCISLLEHFANFRKCFAWRQGNYVAHTSARA